MGQREKALLLQVNPLLSPIDNTQITLPVFQNDHWTNSLERDFTELFLL